MKKQKVLLVVNPKAGKMTFRKSFYSVVQMFSCADYEVLVHFTTGSGDAAKTVEQKANEVDLIVTCGGDGTFNETVTGILNSGVMRRIGYIPCGSTNDFASTLGITGSPEMMAQNIIKGSNVTIDAGKFNDRYFSYTASFGAFTAISYGTPQSWKNKLGHLAYVLNGAKEILHLPKIKMKVTTPELTVEDTFIYGGVTNTTSIGGLYSLPEEEVVLNDGFLELLLVKVPKTKREFAKTMISLCVRDYNDPNLIFLHTKEAVFESEQPVPFTLDGEFGGAQTKSTVSCIPNGITVNGKIR